MLSVFIGILHHLHNQFEMHDWSNPAKAKELLAKGFQIAETNPSKEKIRNIVMDLYKLLPSVDEPLPINDDHVLSD